MLIFAVPGSWSWARGRGLAGAGSWLGSVAIRGRHLVGGYGAPMTREPGTPYLTADARPRLAGPVRRGVAVLVAVLTVLAVAGCSRDPLEESYDRWATAFNYPEGVGKHDVGSLTAAASANCGLQTGELEPRSDNMGTIKNMAAILMASCPLSGVRFIQDRIDQGPSSGPLRDELTEMLVRAKIG